MVQTNRLVRTFQKILEHYSLATHRWRRLTDYHYTNLAEHRFFAEQSENSSLELLSVAAVENVKTYVRPGSVLRQTLTLLVVD